MVSVRLSTAKVIRKLIMISRFQYTYIYWINDGLFSTLFDILQIGYLLVVFSL